jgi:pyrimidine-nucleoside phosphorylase
MGTVLFPQHVIARKRDGAELDRAEIAAFVRGSVDGSWADYQLSALLMAIFLRGMTPRETAFLTEAMLKSGVVADLSAVRAPKADKHSTGGVGDKVSLHLAPMVAACGVAVPMISGRGLGHTGGTLDKLEAIPGFRVGLSIAEYRRQLKKIGLALIGQTAELAPADRKLYALRDVTATVECIPLICASILSKKLAEGIDVLVLDVKYGRGAFMKDKAKARELAVVITTVARAMGKPTTAVMTAMEEPLGHAVGNALEVAESVECLKGLGARDLMEVTFAVGEQMLLLAGAAKGGGAGRRRAGRRRSRPASPGEAQDCARQPALRLRDRCRRDGSRVRGASPRGGPQESRGQGRSRRRRRPPREGGRSRQGGGRAVPDPREERRRGEGGSRDAPKGHHGRQRTPRTLEARGRGDRRLTPRPRGYFSRSASSVAAFSQAAVAAQSWSTTALSSRFRCWALPGSV